MRSEDDGGEVEATLEQGPHSVTPSQELGSMASMLAALARTESVAVAPGTLVADQYRIERCIGEGGMGMVFLARDVHLDRRVAVKVCTGLAASAVHRIQREAIALAKLAHPNVVVLYQAGALDDRFFIAMEYVEGGNAREWLEQQPRTWREIVDVYVQAARGLHAAHRVGIVHRDFKPDNVLVGRDGRVRVADFGLARPAVGVPETTDDDAPPIVTGSVTRTAWNAGTPAYMAPEQMEGRPLDAAADQFSLCVALHEALWGLRPTVTTSLDEHPGTRRVGERPGGPGPSRDVPRRLQEVLQRGLAEDPRQRWPDLQALVRALLHDPGARRRRIGLTAAGLLTVGAVAWFAGSSARPEPCADVERSIEATWSDARRTEVADSLRSTGSPTAASVIDPVTQGLDDWAAQWQGQRREACEATRVRGEQSEARMDERMDCLERVRVEAAAIIDVLARADREVVVRAPTMVESLPDASRCADAEALAAVDAVPPARRGVYDPLHARLAEGRAEYTAGRIEHAHALFDGVLDEARREGFAGLTAQALAARSRTLGELGRHPEAIVDASAAIGGALRSHDDALLAYAAQELAVALGRTSVGTDEALRWLEVARAASARAGLHVDASLALSRVQIFYYGDRNEQAEEAAREELAALGPDHVKRVGLLSMRGAALQRLSRWDEAIEVHREAVALAERLRGPDHPGVAAALMNLAQTMQVVGRGEEAFGLVERAVAIRVAAYGEDSPTAADAYRVLADAYLTLGDLRAAREEYERAVAIHRRRHDEVGLSFALGNLAMVHRGMGDVAGARDLLLEVLPLVERHFGATSRPMAQTAINLSGYLLELDQVGEAEAYGRQAVALAERVEGEGPLAAGACMNLAQILGRQGRTEEALGLLDRAAEINAATQPANAPEHAHVLLSRASVLRDGGRTAEAAEAGVKAADSMERAVGPEHYETIQALSLAAGDLLAAGDRARARERLERAQLASEHGTVAPVLGAQLRFQLATALWGERTERSRAIALASGALADLQALGDAQADEVRAWLVDRGAAPGEP